MVSIQIAHKIISDDSRTFIVAEAGVNHNGSVNKALQLVDAAVDAGADAVKFQTWDIEELYIPDEISGRNYRKESKKRHLSYNDFKSIADYCRRKSIIFMSTPDDEKSADFLETIAVPAYKIGSAEITNLPFLSHVAKKNLPVILSTGMSTMSEISAAVNSIKEINSKIILMHCTSSYPSNIDHLNLRMITRLKKEFSLLSGLSDHSVSEFIPAIAVAMGAKVIEKHFTVNKNWSGPDNRLSLNPRELKKMIDLIRLSEKALGNDTRHILNSEKSSMYFARKCIVAAYDLKAGCILEPGMFKFKRPYLGLSADMSHQLAGRKLAKDIRKDFPIRLNDCI